MIRQFGFTWTAISWLLMGYGLFLPLSFAGADRHQEILTRAKERKPARSTEAVGKGRRKNILFTYNGTESYRVTVSIREKTEREAIDLVLTGKPFPLHRTGRVFRRTAEEIGQSHRRRRQSI